MLNNKYRLFFLLFFFGLPCNLLAAVLVNELMYDLPGSDQGREWIEIYNSGNEAVDLNGWNIETTSNHRPFVLISGSFLLHPSGFAVIVENPEIFKNDYPDFSGSVLKSAFSLRNTFGKVILKNKDEAIDVVNYVEALGGKGDGNSIQRFGNNWEAYIPTLGSINKVVLLKIQEEKPVVLSVNKEKQLKTETVGKKTLILSDEKSLEKDITKEGEVLGVFKDQGLGGNPKGNSIFKWILVLIGLFVAASLPIIFSSRPDPAESFKIIEE